MLNQQQETVIILNADHNGICKFPNTQDNKYRTISSRIKAEVDLFNDPRAVKAHEERVGVFLQLAPPQSQDS